MHQSLGWIAHWYSTWDLFVEYIFNSLFILYIIFYTIAENYHGHLKNWRVKFTSVHFIIGFHFMIRFHFISLNFIDFIVVSESINCNKVHILPRYTNMYLIHINNESIYYIRDKANLLPFWLPLLGNMHSFYFENDLFTMEFPKVHYHHSRKPFYTKGHIINECSIWFWSFL